MTFLAYTGVRGKSFGEIDIFGEGELREDLEAFVRDKQIRASFHGCVLHDELPQIFSRYTYYVLPSYYEGLPKTLLEAMACGCVCIGTDVAGIGTIIEDGKTGFLAQACDSVSLKTSIERAFASPQCTNISRNGAVMIRDQFSLDACMHKEKALYQLLGIEND